jgi:hypothetical protein
MGVVVWRDDVCGMTVKGTTTTSEASMVWCSSQGGDKIEMQLSGGESDQG